MLHFFDLHFLAFCHGVNYHEKEIAILEVQVALLDGLDGRLELHASGDELPDELESVILA